MVANLSGPVEDGVATPDQQTDAYAAALLRERDGYIARGLGARVTAIEAELVRIGYELVPTEEAPKKGGRGKKEQATAEDEGTEQATAEE